MTVFLVFFKRNRLVTLDVTSRSSGDKNTISMSVTLIDTLPATEVCTCLTISLTLCVKIHLVCELWLFPFYFSSFGRARIMHYSRN